MFVREGGDRKGGKKGFHDSYSQNSRTLGEAVEPAEEPEVSWGSCHLASVFEVLKALVLVLFLPEVI